MSEFFSIGCDRRITNILLGLGLVVSYLIVVGLPFPNEDLFVAFCSGRDTIHGLLGAPNQWSYTVPASVWVDQSWLAHLSLYLSYVMIGASGPILIKAVLVAVALALVFARCRALGASRKASIVALTFGTLAIAPYANARAHLFGMLTFVVLARLVTLPSRNNRAAQIGSVAVIALWSNLHGSFMLGFFFLGLRAFVETIAELRFRLMRWGTPAGRGLENTDPLGWLLAVAAAAIAMAYANPYGPANLLMPFHQFFGTERTVPWKDWLPLLSRDAMTDLGAFKARSPLIVLSFLGWIGILLAAFVVLIGPSRAWERLKMKMAAPDSTMEILLPVMLVPLMFKFGRLVIFAVPILVPAVAILMNVVLQLVTDKRPSFRRHAQSGMGPRTALVCALLLVLCAGFIFYHNVVVPLLPNNPLSRLRSDSGISSRLLSYNFVGQGVARFMRQNRLSGPVFCNFTLSDFLLLEVPGIQVFMDLRAHSAYPAQVIETAAWMMYSGQTDIEQTLGILDRYHVEHVVLDTCDDECRGLLNGLLSTGKWGCIYRERNGCIFALTRAESSTFRSLLDGPDENTPWYETPEDRAIAESVALLFTRGSLPLSMRQRLESIAQSRPDPGIYVLIAGGSECPLPCLDEGLRSFFRSEFHRLAGASYLVAGGLQSIVMSAAKIAEILEADACLCSQERSCEQYASARKRILQEAEDIRRRYRPL